MTHGFGMVGIRQEGRCSSYENPEIPPWDGCGKEFEDYFNKEYGHKWYFFLLKKALRKISHSGWDAALLMNAKKTHKE